MYFLLNVKTTKPNTIFHVVWLTETRTLESYPFFHTLQSCGELGNDQGGILVIPVPTTFLGLPHHKVIQLSPSVKIPQKWSLILGVLNEHKIQVLKATYVNNNNSEVVSHGTCGSVFVIHLPVSISKRRLDQCRNEWVQLNPNGKKVAGVTGYV